VEILGVAAILAITAGLRFVSIGEKSFTADEAFAAYKAAQPIPTIITMSAREDTQPPLYYVVLSLWSRTLGWDDITLRSLGVITNVLTVAGIYWVARSLGGSNIGKLAAFLAAISPFQILAAQEARNYSLLGLLTLISWATLLVAVQGRRWGWITYVGATVLTLYTHYLAFLTVVGQGVFVLLAAPLSRREWLASQLVILGLILPWLGKASATVSGIVAWVLPRQVPISTDLTTLLGFLSFGGHAFGFGGWFAEPGKISLIERTAILSPFLALTFCGVAALWKGPRTLWILVGYLLVPMVVMAVLFLRAGIFTPRYFSFLYPPFGILLSFGISYLAQRIVPARYGVAALVLGGLVLLFNAAALYDAQTDPKYDVFNWRGVATLLTKQAGPNDLITVFPEFDRIGLVRYFHGGQQVQPSSKLIMSHSPEQSAELAVLREGRGLFRSYAASHEVMWIVIGYQISPPAIRTLNAQLAGIYDVREMTNFNAIRVFRATRHQP
jgi:uncharacterized membrane protein